MTHLPFIAASYAVFAVIVAGLAGGSLRRLARAKARLRALDTRAARGEAA